MTLSQTPPASMATKYDQVKFLVGYIVISESHYTVTAAMATISRTHAFTDASV